MALDGLARKLFWRCGLDVKRASLPGSSLGLTLNLLTLSRADVVLDIGANEGQFASELQSYRPAQTVISFEPGSDAHRKLSTAAKKVPNWIVAERVALGAEAGVATLNLTLNSQCSSLRSVAEDGPKLASAFDDAGVEEVKVERLDRVALPEIERADKIYLKLDVQGFEKEVFEGCQNLLPRIAAIQVEMSMRQVYKGQSTGLASLQQFLDAGYALYGISNGWRDDKTGHLVQFDAFLIKSASPQDRYQ